MKDLLVQCGASSCNNHPKYQALCDHLFCEPCIFHSKLQGINQKLVWKCLHPHCDQLLSPMFIEISSKTIKTYDQIKKELNSENRKWILVGVCFLVVFGTTAVKILLNS